MPASTASPAETKGKNKAKSTAAVQPNASSAATAAAGAAPDDHAEPDGAAATPLKQVSLPCLC